MEKLIKENITQYLERNNLIYESQHGFRKQKSCLTNLLEFLEYILGYVDQGEAMDVVFLDLQKAFDKVPHRRLSEKIKAIGIEGKVCVWIQEWLRGRKQRVVLNGKSSEWVEVTSGVPQGSVLGPLLFLIYINDMDEILKSRIWKFADDTKLAMKVSTTEGINDLREDLKALTKWCADWQMDFNVKKCKVMHFGNHNLRAKYSMNGTELVDSNEEKDLGVIICQDLKVSQQCHIAAKKANQILGLIYRTIASRNSDIIIRLYKSLVRPHLDYCIQAWRPYLKKDMDVMEKVQRRVTRMIEGFKGLEYGVRLKKVGLTTLETRRVRADLLEVFKIVKGFEGLREESFFERRGDSGCRGHKYTLSKKRFRTNLGKFSFGNRVINFWNSLPEKVVLEDNIIGFKIGLDHYLGCRGD
jgi:hypothetical protein